MSEEKRIVFVDGGARGNPGPAAIGVVVCDKEGGTVFRFGKTIGKTTNNVAEYQSVIAALSLLAKRELLGEAKQVEVRLDSQLVYSQIAGLFKVKNAMLRSLLFAVRVREAELAVSVSYKYIPREENKEADRLVNMALDKRI